MKRLQSGKRQIVQCIVFFVKYDRINLQVKTMITKFDRFVLEKLVYLGNVPALVRAVLSIQLRLEESLAVSVLLQSC